MHLEMAAFTHIALFKMIRQGEFSAQRTGRPLNLDPSMRKGRSCRSRAVNVRSQNPDTDEVMPNDRDEREDADEDDKTDAEEDDLIGDLWSEEDDGSFKLEDTEEEREDGEDAGEQKDDEDEPPIEGGRKKERRTKRKLKRPSL